MCECARMRLRRDLMWHLLLWWIGSVAGPFNRQQLLVLTASTTLSSLQSLQDYKWGPDTTHSAPYHHLLSLQLLSSRIAIPLSKGHDPNRSEGNVKLTWEKHQKWTSISILAPSGCRKSFPDSCWQTEIPGIWLVWPVCALLLCGSLPCVWLSGSENIPCGITEEDKQWGMKTPVCAVFQMPLHGLCLIFFDGD